MNKTQMIAFVGMAMSIQSAFGQVPAQVDKVGGGTADLHVITSTSCTATTDCKTCADMGCGWNSLGQCMDSCEKGSKSCFSKENNPLATTIEMCVIAEHQKPKLPPSLSIDDISDCSECVSYGFAFAEGMCIKSCYEIADAPCYSYEWFPKKMSKWICGLQEYEKTQNRGGGRSLQSPPLQCDEVEDCNTCLNMGCVREFGKCTEACEDMRYASCFGLKYFPGWDSKRICSLEDEEAHGGRSLKSPPLLRGSMQGV